MDTIELLAKFADPEVIKTLSMTERLIGGLIVTFLGMGITLFSLVILQFAMVIMGRLSQQSPVKKKEVSVPAGEYAKKSAENDLIDDEEVVAAVTAAIALQLKTSMSRIVIRNIEKIEEPSSAWRKAGISEQMNNSL